jgi:hypothetical protein
MMHKFNIGTHLLIGIVLSGTILSCSCGNPEIIHLDFADNVNFVHPVFGSDKDKDDTSRKAVNIHFLINESSKSCYGEPVINKFIDTSRFIQQQIKNGYYDLRVTFYHKSENTDAMLKLRTNKALTLCNDDIISEYGWREGKPSDTLFYEHGQIKGSEKIKLEGTK